MQNFYIFMMFSHLDRERNLVIQGNLSFFLLEVVCYKHFHIYILDIQCYGICIYKMWLFIFIVVYLDFIRSTLESRQIFLVLTIIMTSLEVTLSFEMHLKLICIPCFMSNKSNAFFQHFCEFPGVYICTVSSNFGSL